MIKFLKFRTVFLLVLMSTMFGVQASTTHIVHVIKNDTPFEFYYIVIPASEVPTAFSCNCSGLISPGEEQNCDCYSDIEAADRRYRIEYMKNTSPSYRVSVTYNAESNVIITWKFVFDHYWEWISVKTSQKPLEEN